MPMKRFVAILLFLLALAIPALAQDTGCVLGDCENGHGTYKYPNGDVYIGN